MEGVSWGGEEEMSFKHVTYPEGCSDVVALLFCSNSLSISSSDMIQCHAHHRAPHEAGRTSGAIP